MNNDTENTARSIYLTLAKPFSEEKGLNKTIEVEDLILYLGDEYSSNTLFYNGKYTDWSNSYYIEKLAPGDLREVDITVKLKEGAKFEKGSYECKLYIYQEKYLDKEEYVDDISFTITI